MVGRGRQCDVARGQTPSRRDQRLALAKIHSGRAQIVACRHAADERDAIAFAPHFLLNDDGVGAFGHWRSGEDPDRLARTNAAAKRAPGRGFADHGQARRGLRCICGAQGIAVHCGIGEGRLGAQSRKVARQHPAVSGFQRDLLFIERRLGRRKHPGERVFD